MLISRINFQKDYSNIQYRNNYQHPVNFQGQLESDYFEASKTGNIQKQLKSISNYRFDVTERDIETQDNFLHAALKSANKLIINKALILLGQKDTELIQTIVEETNTEGKKPYEYTSDSAVISRLENLTNKTLIPSQSLIQEDRLSPKEREEIVPEVNQEPVKTPELKLNELPPGTVLRIPDDDEDDADVVLDSPIQTTTPPAGENNGDNTIPPLNEIAGLHKAKNILQKRIVEPLISGKKVTDSGFLLYSATKCGKSFLLQSLAKSLNRTIIDEKELEKLVEKAISANENSTEIQQNSISKILNENIIQVSDVQALENVIGFAKENYRTTKKQTVIFIDEIKGILPDVNAASSNYVTKAEQLIEDSAQKGFVIVATTRGKDEISPDSIRVGRFDKKIELKLPTKDEREEFINKYLELNIDKEAYTLLLNKTAGFSYKDVKNIIDELNEAQKTDKSSIDKELKIYAKENNLGELSDSGTTANYDSDEFRRVPAEITFKDVAGMRDVKKKFQINLIDRLKPDSLKWFKEHGNRPPVNSGFLLYGPPGTGKTFIAEAVAGETKIPMYKIDTSTIKDKYYGSSEKKIRKLFTQLETKFEETGEYSILFIDEANSLLAKRNKELSSKSLSSGSGDSNLVDLFLQYLNKAPKRGIIPIIATNFKDEIDDAILDRLQTQIEIQLPDDELREAMVRQELTKLPEYTKNINDDDVKEIVIRLGGLSSRTISAVLEKALDNCSLHPERPMTVKDFTDAINNYAIEHDLPEINENSKTSGYDGRWKRKTVKFPADFSDVAGMDDVKKVFQATLIDRLKPEALARFKNDGNRNPIQSNFLLYGPPGTGKTFIAEALAGEMKVPLYELTSADIKSGLYGESEKNIKAVFDQLEKKFKRTGEYSILFVDEANDLFRSANDGIGNAGKSLTNLFLQKTNNSAERGIIVIAATNYKDQIEDAMLSRLGKQIYISLPDEKLRKALIESEIGKSSITKNIKDEDIAELVELLSGFSSRDISKILKETINEQLTYSDSQLSIGDFKKQIDHFIANRDDNLQKSVYKNKLRLLADNLTETEAEEVMNLYIEYKRQQKAKNAEGK